MYKLQLAFKIAFVSILCLAIPTVIIGSIGITIGLYSSVTTLYHGFDIESLILLVLCIAGICSLLSIFNSIKEVLNNKHF